MYEGTIGYYNTLAKADLGLGSVTIPSGKTSYEVGDSVASGDYDDSSKLVGTEAIAQYANVVKAVNSLATTATTEEKLAKADEAIAEAKAAIDEKYEDVIESAKEQAVKDLNDAIKEFASDKVVASYLDDDAKDELVSDSKAAIEAATSLSGLDAVMATSYKASSSAKTTSKGSVRTMLAAQSEILSDIDSALGEAVKGEDLLNVQTDVEGLAKQATLIELIEDKGVAVDKLPTEIANSYAEKVLASRTFEKYTSGDHKGEYVLAADAIDELEDSVDGVKTELFNAILNEYYTEVNSLEEISADTKTKLRVSLESAAANWKKDRTESANAKVSIKSLLGYDEISADGTVTYNYTVTKKVESGHTTEVDNTKTNLVAVLENVLDTTDNSAVQTERLNKVLATYKAEFAAERDAVLAADATYKAALNWKETSSGSKEYKASVTKFGEESWEIGNFIFDLANQTSKESSSEAELAAAAKINNSDSSMKDEQIAGNYYDVNKVYDNLTNKNSDTVTTDNFTSKASTKTVAAAKEWGDARKGLVSSAYSTFLTNYASKVGDGLSKTYESKNDLPVFYKGSDISEAFTAQVKDSTTNKLKVSNMDEVTKLGKSAISNVQAIVALDQGLTKFLVGDYEVKYVGNNNQDGTKGTDGVVKHILLKSEGAAKISDDQFFTAKLAGVVTKNGDIYSYSAEESQKTEAKITPDLSLYFTKGTSSFYDATLNKDVSTSALSKVLNGSMSLSQVQSFVKEDNLKSLYNADCASYMDTVLETLQNYVKNLSYSGTVTPTELAGIKARLAKVEAMIGEGKWVYSGDATKDKVDSTTKDDQLLKLFEQVGILSSDKKLATEDVTTASFSIAKAATFQAKAFKYIAYNNVDHV